MSSRKDIKQTVNYVCRGLFAECIAASLYNNVKNEESVNTLLSCIITLRNDFVCRISHPEPGIAPKKYFTILINDFEKRVNEIVDQISNLH